MKFGQGNSVKSQGISFQTEWMDWFLDNLITRHGLFNLVSLDYYGYQAKEGHIFD